MESEFKRCNRCNCSDRSLGRNGSLFSLSNCLDLSWQSRHKTRRAQGRIFVPLSNYQASGKGKGYRIMAINRSRLRWCMYATTDTTGAGRSMVLFSYSFFPAVSAVMFLAFCYS